MPGTQPPRNVRDAPSTGSSGFGAWLERRVDPGADRCRDLSIFAVTRRFGVMPVFASPDLVLASSPFRVAACAAGCAGARCVRTALGFLSCSCCCSPRSRGTASTARSWSIDLTLWHLPAAPNSDTARAVGLASAVRGEPGYYPWHDRDQDRLTCEPWPYGMPKLPRVIRRGT